MKVLKLSNQEFFYIFQNGRFDDWGRWKTEGLQGSTSRFRIEWTFLFTGELTALLRTLLFQFQTFRLFMARNSNLWVNLMRIPWSKGWGTRHSLSSSSLFTFHFWIYLDAYLFDYFWPLISMSGVGLVDGGIPCLQASGTHTHDSGAGRGQGKCGKAIGIYWGRNQEAGQCYWLVLVIQLFGFLFIGSCIHRGEAERASRHWRWDCSYSAAYAGRSRRGRCEDCFWIVR